MPRIDPKAIHIYTYINIYAYIYIDIKPEVDVTIEVNFSENEATLAYKKAYLGQLHISQMHITWLYPPLEPHIPPTPSINWVLPHINLNLPPNIISVLQGLRVCSGSSVPCFVPLYTTL